jgi:multisubunit Na+/H+ antiporter MnhG subunit
MLFHGLPISMFGVLTLARFPDRFSRTGLVDAGLVVGLLVD